MSNTSLTVTRTENGAENNNNKETTSSSSSSSSSSQTLKIPHKPMSSVKAQALVQQQLNGVWKLMVEPYWNSYASFVRDNRDAVRYFENIMRFASFLVPGRYGHSAVSGEMLYATSNIMGTATDRILGEENTPTLFVGYNEPPLIRNLKVLVTIIQHLQLLIELISIRRWTPQQRWKIIASIEFIKAVIRLYLLYYFEGRMLILPTDQEMKDNHKRQTAEAASTYPTLQRMYYDFGRGPHPHGHFSPLSRPVRAELHRKKNETTATKNNGETTTTIYLNPSQQEKDYQQEVVRRKRFSAAGEVLYIIRPAVYVFTYIQCGMDDNNWRPFRISLFLDIASQMLHLARGCSERSHEELKRRRFLWLMYLLRAPFFQHYVRHPLYIYSDVLQARNSKIRFWIIKNVAEILNGYRDLYFNTCASNY